MKKLTKIIATLGPATDSEEKISNLIKAGVDVFRFNFKHNTIEWHDENVKRINRVADKTGFTVGTLIDIPNTAERNLEGLKIASRNEVDFVALSYIKTSDSIEKLRKQMTSLKVKAKIIAKIETKEAIENLKSIIRAADGIMVARGDLGKALPMEEVPYYQKLIIKESIKHTKPVVTATEMLQSMVESPIPTRAEISDVANATYDLTDAVMLSAETALGQYSVEAVKFMYRTAAFNEKKNLVDSRLRFNFELNDYQELLADSAYSLYLQSRKLHIGIAGFLVFTQTGRTARLISRYRPLIPIFASVGTKAASDGLSVSYGVFPFLQNEQKMSGELTKRNIHQATDFLVKKGIVSSGQLLIALLGDYWGKAGEISTVKVVKA